MKNIILGAIGAFVILYTILCGLCLYNTTVRQEEMENALSQVIKQTLKEGYGQKVSFEHYRQLTEDIRYRMNSNSEVEIVIHHMDLEKGIIRVSVREQFRQLNGQKKELSWSKTAIVDVVDTDIWKDIGTEEGDGG